MGIIEKRIESIIEKRKTLLPKIEAKESSIKAATEMVQKIERFKNKIIDSNGELKSDSQYYNLFASNRDALYALSSLDLNNFMSYSKSLVEKISVLKSRFSRDFINIAVIGPARQGKSRFLQSVSGLDDKCIPAFSGGHCTGASSTIENGEIVGVRAEISYKTEKEMIAEINDYLNIISAGNKQIYALDEVKNLSKETLLKWVKQYVPESDDIEAMGAAELLFERYCDESHYNIWRPLIGNGAEVFTDENIIMTYVAQHNGETEYKEDGTINQKFKKFYKFVAVKSARITTRFTYKDCGRIKMIDTVGLGSIEKNTEQNMIDTIKKDSDGVIFFKRPEAATVGTSDQDDQKIYRLIKHEFFERKMDKWFAYILNHTLETEKFKDNGVMCGVVRKNIESNALPLLSLSILDVSDSEKVQNDFLVPYLTALSNNIEEIDKVFIDETLEDSINLFDAYEAICKKFIKIINVQSGIGNRAKDQIRFETIRGNFTAGCRDINNGYAMQKNEVCEILSSNCEGIIENIFDFLPEAEAVKEYISADGRRDASTAYRYYLDGFRAGLTERFIGIDVELSSITNRLKNEYAKAMIETGRLGKILPINEGEEGYLWLRRFAESVDADTYPQIRFTLDFLNDFEFGVRGFMMYRIRSSIFAISRANPNLLANVVFKGDVEKGVVHYLKIAIKDVQDKLKDTLKQFYTAPNEALFAASDEFFDRIIYSQNVENEWREFYLDEANIMKIWSEEIKEEIKTQQVMSEWIALWEDIKKYERKDCFLLG